jgi:aspartyl-tRNA(Asn)/glutamyl-tRNA(Gln) amidotransferase subunit C
MLAPEDVRKVASLARLKLSDDEIAEFSEQLGNVLDYVEVLNELDVTDVEPMAHAAEVTDVLRDDAIRESLPRDAALANAPKSDGRFFLVPQILENA